MSEPIRLVSQIGELIRTERKRQGLVQRDLAELSGVSWHFLSNLENGKPTAELEKTMLVLRSLGIDMRLTARHASGEAR